MYSITIDLGKHTSPMDGMGYIDFCFKFSWVGLWDGALPVFYRQ